LPEAWEEIWRLKRCKIHKTRSPILHSAPCETAVGSPAVGVSEESLVTAADVAIAVCPTVILPRFGLPFAHVLSDARRMFRAQKPEQVLAYASNVVIPRLG
jgi:hypothetical protein